MAFTSNIDDQIAAVQASIDAALKSQEYQQGASRQKRPDIEKLFRILERLQDKKNIVAGGESMAVFGTVVDPT